MAATWWWSDPCLAMLSTNRANPEYYPRMKENLAMCSGTIKDFLFTSGTRNGRVMDPARCLSGLAAAETWGTDPIHPIKEVYGLLADGVIEVEKSCGRSRTRTVSTAVNAYEEAGFGSGTSYGRGGGPRGHSGRASPRPHGGRGHWRGRRGGEAGGGPTGRGLGWRGGGGGGGRRGQWRDRWSGPY